MDGLDKGLHPGPILEALGPFDAAGNIDPPGPHRLDGRPDRLRRQSPGQQQAALPGHRPGHGQVHLEPGPAKALGVDTDGMSPGQACMAGVEVLWELYEKIDQPTSFKDVDAVDDAFIERAVNNILGDTAKLEATPRRPDIERGFDEFSAVLQAAKTGNIDAVPE